MSSPILQQVAERAQVYELLGWLWRDVADADFLEQLSGFPTDGMPPSWADFIGECHSDPEELAAEFTRLLIGPKNHLPPFQSVWQERQLGGEAAASMKQYAEVAGMDRANDHLGTQFELMSQMLMDALAYEEGEVLELLSCYFRDHLTWPDTFLAAVRNRAEMDFFRKLSAFTVEFLADEALRFGLTA